MKKSIIKILLLIALYTLIACNNNSTREEKPIKQIESQTGETVESTNKEELNKSSSLLYIMPKYKEVIYSKAYYRQFVKKDLDKLRECYGQLAEKLNNEEIDKAEKSIAMKNYEQIESFVLKAEKNEIEQEKYEKLEPTDYMDYIQKETTYEKKESLSKSNYSLKIQSVQTNDMYFSFDCDIKMPYLIPKKEIERLKIIAKEDEDEATIVIELPINKEGMVSSRENNATIKKIKLYYDGDDGFLYYVGGKEIDANQRAISIREYNKDQYAFFEDDYWQIEHVQKKINLKVLKDANIGQGRDFRQISTSDDEYSVGDDDTKYFYDISDLFRRILDGESSFLLDKEYFEANFLRFDPKGYVTDIYYFEEAEY